MKNVLIAIGIAFVFTAGIFAQEFKADAVQNKPESNVSPVTTAPVNDPGANIAYKAQEASIQYAQKNATDQINEFLNSKKPAWSEGYDEDQGRYIVVGEGAVNCNDPSTDSTIMEKREIAAKIAILRGKTKIIEFINTKMSAEDRLYTPGTDINAQLNEPLEKNRLKLEAIKRELGTLTEATDKTQIEAIKGVEWSDRLKASFDAIIKKLDSEYSSDKIAADKKAKYEDIKKQYEDVKVNFDKLQDEAKKLSGSKTREFKSDVEKLAAMPLYGATVIAQAESWDKNSKLYIVSVAFVWSKNLERAARSMVTGENFKIKPGDVNIKDWLNKQDLSVMVGPRQFLDDKGTRWFLGITAREVGTTAASREKSQDLAEMFAEQMMMFCIYADVESYKKATQIMQTRVENGQEIDTALESMEKKLTQSFKDKTIRGMQKLTSKEIVHPVSGKKIYVYVAGINPQAAIAALELEKINYATKIMDNKQQSLEKGRADAIKKAVKSSENDPESYKKGEAEGTAVLNTELDARKKTDDKAQKKGGAKDSEKSGKGSKEGVFMGDKDIDETF